jgi:hypothetical protein
MKRLRKYAMPMIPDSKSFLFDFYCCMGCFYCIESGLMMDEEQLKNGQENVVFTKLFLMKTNNVASALATAMRKIITVVLGEKYLLESLYVVVPSQELHIVVFSLFWSYVYILDTLLEHLLIITSIQQIHSMD